jgi:hypothetical protein
LTKESLDEHNRTTHVTSGEKLGLGIGEQKGNRVEAMAYFLDIDLSHEVFAGMMNELECKSPMERFLSSIDDRLGSMSVLVETEPNERS